MTIADLDQANLFIELVRVTRIHQNEYFKTKGSDELKRAKEGEKRIDLFISGGKLNRDLSIKVKVAQTTLFNQEEFF